MLYWARCIIQVCCHDYVPSSLLCVTWKEIYQNLKNFILFINTNKDQWKNV